MRPSSRVALASGAALVVSVVMVATAVARPDPGWEPSPYPPRPTEELYYPLDPVPRGNPTAPLPPPVVVRRC